MERRNVSINVTHSKRGGKTRRIRNVLIVDGVETGARASVTASRALGCGSGFCRCIVDKVSRAGASALESVI